MVSLLLNISQWSIPLLLLFILGVGLKKKVPIYDVFIKGAMEGIKTTIKLTPYILAIFVAIGIFRVSGALDFIVYIFRPILNFLGIPPDILTLAVLKPLSGSASLGVTADLLHKYGADSKVGITASIIQGSSETTLYILSLYLGCVNITKSRHLLFMGLTGEIVAFLLAIGIGSWFGKN